MNYFVSHRNIFTHVNNCCQGQELSCLPTACGAEIGDNQTNEPVVAATPKPCVNPSFTPVPIPSPFYMVGTGLFKSPTLKLKPNPNPAPLPTVLPDRSLGRKDRYVAISQTQRNQLIKFLHSL